MGTYGPLSYITVTAEALEPSMLAVMTPRLTLDLFISRPRATDLPEQQGLVKVVWQQVPWRILWGLRSDGVLLSCTYRKDQEVLGWAKHPRGGTIRDIAVIPAPGGDAEDLWLAVERTIGGVVRNYVEIIQPRVVPASAADTDRFVYLDSSLEYDGAATDTVTGLGHLEGQTVGILADGKLHPDVAVSNGAVTLEFTASRIQVGLKFTALMKTLKPVLGDGQGSGLGRRKRIAKIRVLHRDTIGGKIGAAEDDLRPLLRRPTGSLMDLSDRLQSGFTERAMNGPWERDGQFFIVQDEPLPMSIDGLIPVYEGVGE